MLVSKEGTSNHLLYQSKPNVWLASPIQETQLASGKPSDLNFPSHTSFLLFIKIQNIQKKYTNNNKKAAYICYEQAHVKRKNNQLYD